MIELDFSSTDTYTCTAEIPKHRTYTYTIEKTKYYDTLEYLYLLEEKEWCKTGWNNPKKQPLPKQYNHKRILINTRNKLKTKTFKK